MFLSEIFFGWQGEGPFAGFPQVFVRTAGCPLRCAYCDTPASLVRTASCRVREGGEHDEATAADVPNPVTAAWAAFTAERLARGRPLHAVSITGGEPLAQEREVAALAAALRARGFRTYLETAGVWPERFARVASLFDHVAADVKIPAAAREPARWEEHAAFLAAADPARTFVKAVVTADTPDAEIIRAARLVAARSPDIPFFLQPATPAAPAVAPPAAAQMRRWAALAGRFLRRVHGSGQWHLPKPRAAEAVSDRIPAS